MQDEYGSDFITITDDDGKEYELEVLAELDYNGSHYLALIPAAEDDEQEELEVSILKQTEEDGETILLTVDDETELENVYNAFMDLIYEEDGTEN